MLARLNGTSIKTLLANFAIDAPDIDVTDLVLDSREVAIHKGFVAIKGHALDGRDFIPQAVSLGAKVILAECDEPAMHGEISMREQSVIIQFYDLATQLSELAAKFYCHPALNLDVVAVTGTNGKTSTVQLISQLRHLLGDTAASIGTLGAGIYSPKSHDAVLESTLNTTPDAIVMQRLLAKFVQTGCQQVALEASSHALVQGRIAHLKTDIAVFTNLTRDHLDYHGSMAEYARAKRTLLTQPGLKHVILNFDDKEHTSWEKAAAPHLNICYTSLVAKPDDLPANGQYCIAKKIDYVTDGCQIQIATSWGDMTVKVALLGAFNVANLLVAILVQLLNDFSLSSIEKICSSLTPVAGRMEVFLNTNGANVVVDYAHTPDALKQALVAAREHCKGKLICIFGCGGDRDQGKRPLMGESAEQYADIVFVTNDNSRSEQPEKIVDDILRGCRQPEVIRIELDRKAAIKQALTVATENDLILVAGKGHEDYQIIGKQVLPYNEREYVQALLEGREQ